MTAVAPIAGRTIGVRRRRWFRRRIPWNDVECCAPAGTRDGSPPSLRAGRKQWSALPPTSWPVLPTCGTSAREVCRSAVEGIRRPSLQVGRTGSAARAFVPTRCCPRGCSSDARSPRVEGRHGSSSSSCSPGPRRGVVVAIRAAQVVIASRAGGVAAVAGEVVDGHGVLPAGWHGLSSARQRPGERDAAVGRRSGLGLWGSFLRCLFVAVRAGGRGMVVRRRGTVRRCGRVDGFRCCLVGGRLLAFLALFLLRIE